MIAWIQFLFLVSPRNVTGLALSSMVVIPDTGENFLVCMN
jgi:hypothetical protein